MERQILVTGTGSYIGTSFQKYVTEKNAAAAAKEQWGITFVSVRNEDWKQMDFSEYDTILHVAAIVHRKEKADMESLYEQVNTKLTLELAKKAKAEGVRQFVFFSTMSVYGVVRGRVTPETIPSPVNFYGKSKLEAERGLRQFEDAEFRVAIVRPPMVYGRGCRGNYRALEKLAKKTPFFPMVKNERSMIYIDNLSECLLQIIKKRLSGVYYPQNRQYVNTSDMVARIAESCGRKVILVPGFQRLLMLLGRKVGLCAKVFGSLTYEREMSFPPELENYEEVDFERSIRETESEQVRA